MTEITIVSRLDLPDNVVENILWAIGILAAAWLVFMLLRKMFRPGARRQGHSMTASLELPPEVADPRGGELSDGDLQWLRQSISGLNTQVGTLEQTLGDIRDYLKLLVEQGGVAASNRFLLQTDRRTPGAGPDWDNASAGRYAVAAAPGKSAPADEVRQNYEVLLLSGPRACSVEPLFAILDIAASGPARGIGSDRYYFRSGGSKQSAFVIFRGAASNEGFLFPNPNIAFTEAMRYIFPRLSGEVYETYKRSIDPARVVQVDDQVWEMAVD